MKYLFITSALLAISLTAGCGDDTATPFVFDAGTKDATSSDSGNGGPADASSDVAKDVILAPDSDPETDVDADDSGTDALPE